MWATALSALVAVVACCAALRAWYRVVGLVARCEALEYEVFVHAKANAKIVDDWTARKWRRQDWFNNRVYEQLNLCIPFDYEPPKISDLEQGKDAD